MPVMYPKLFDQPYLNTFGLCFCIGIALCFAVIGHYAREKKVDPEFMRFLHLNGYLAIVVAFSSGVLLQATYDYIENPAAGFHITGAVTFFGGLIGGVGSFLTGYFACGRRKFGPRLIGIMPIVPAGVSIAQACGRIGCFFGGCCYGKPTDSCLGVHFPNLGYKALPTQLYEALFLLVLFAIIFHLAITRSFRQAPALYMISYGAFRFLIEFIRDDPRGRLIGPLSPAQTISLFLVAGSVAVYFATEYLLKEHRNGNGFSSGG